MKKMRPGKNLIKKAENNRSVFRAIAALSLFICLGNFSAYAEDTNREIVKTLVVYYLNSGKFSEAEKYLEGHLNEDPTDADSWRLFGLVLNRRGELKRSQTAFTKAANLTDGVEKGTNLYLRADAEVRAGEIEKGKATLEALKNIPEFAAQVDQANSEIQSNNKVPPVDIERLNAEKAETANLVGQHPVKFTATLASGYDTNVLLLPDFASGVSPSSPYLNPGLQAEYVHSLFGGSFNLQGFGGYTSNLTTEASPYNNLPLGLGLEWRPRSSRWALTNQESLVFINADGLNLFSVSYSLGVKVRLLQSTNQLLELALPVGYTTYPGALATDPDFVRDGYVISPGIVHRHTVGQVFVSEVLSYSRQNSQGSNFRANTYSFLVSGLTQLPYKLTSLLSLGYTLSQYPDSSLGRQDSKINLAMEISKNVTLFAPLLAGIGLGWERNNSTVANASYSKGTVLLKLTYAIN